MQYDNRLSLQNDASSVREQHGPLQQDRGAQFVLIDSITFIYPYPVLAIFLSFVVL